MNNFTTTQNKEIELLASYFKKPIQDAHIYAPLVNALADRLMSKYGRDVASQMSKAAQA